MMNRKHVVKSILSVMLTMAMAMGMLPLSGFVVETKAQDVVKYIDANGAEQECSSYTVLEGGEEATTLGEGWYVVKDTNPNGVDAAYTGTVTINGAANIILCDGAEMSVDVSAGNAITGTSALAIYGQSGQSGKLTVANKVNGMSSIYINEAPLSINGGDIVIDGTEHDKPIYVYSDTLTINGGHISTTKELYSTYPITINGGQVEAGSINGQARDIKLGYRKSTDYIKVGSYFYNSNVVVAEGKAFLTDDNPRVLIKGTFYHGNEHSNINGKKLVPALTLTIADNIEHGSVSVSNGIEDNGVRYVAAGETVDLIISADGGYTLDTLTVKDASDNPITVTNSSFTMPAENVTVSATFVPGGYCGASTNEGGVDSVTWSLDDEGKLTISGTGDMADFDDGSNGSRAPWYSSGASITSVVIENGVTRIGNNAFYECGDELTTITIPDSVTSIGNGAFQYCSGLTTVDIPDSVASIGKSAFEDCHSLTTITIPDSVTSIGNSAFKYCSGLTTVDIPDSVTSIGDYAFWKCDKLTGINIPKNVSNIGKLAFGYCTLLSAINVDGNNSTYASDDGVLFNKDKTMLICYPNGKTGHSYIIPNTVTSIGDYAFYLCDGLSSITIPDSVTSIGVGAFRYCSALQTVYAPAGLNLSNCNIPQAANIINYYAAKLASTEHGTVTVSGGTGMPNCGAYFTNGGTATLSITPDDGYKLDSLTVKDASDNLIPVTNSSFTMPEDKHVTINATFRGSNDDAVYSASDDNTLSGWITRTVSIADKATVTLSNATISGGITCEGDATIILAGNNTVTAQSFHAGIYVPENKTLTINGDGKLDVTGGYFGAGIGGYGIDYTDRHSCGNIIINSGEVTATGGDVGAGIGGGYESDCGNITINGGTVKATGTSSGAGIGGSNNAEFGNIKITGGTVTAQGASGAAGIGGGDCIKSRGTGGNIIITGGTVSATGNGYGTGIGCGTNGGNCRDILISGGNIEAKGGKYSVGIGSTDAANYNSICGSITITDGVESLSVTGGENANYSIGNGEECGEHTSSCGTVTIGGVVTGFISEKKFITKPFSISFAADGGSGDMASKKVMKNVNDNYELPTCTFTAPAGKKFKEWSITTGDAGAVTKAAGESVKITGDTTVTATYVTIVEAPVAVADLIYNGKEQTGVVSGTGYTVTGNNATNAGTYKAKATLQDGYIWSDGTTTAKEIEWSIAKATPSYEAPTGLKATTGQTLANVTLPNGWAWADKTLSVGNAGTNVFKATYTPADTTNYNVVENIELNVTVSNASSNSNSGSTNPGGGSTSPSGGSSSGNTDNKDTTEKTTTPVTEKTTNADGSVTEKTTTTNTDGSKTETSKTTAKDGTITEAEKVTAKDGTVKETEKTTATDGTITESEKTTLTDGSVKEVEKTTTTDGTIVEKTAETDKDGSAVVSEKVTEKDGSSSETTVTVDSNGKAKSIVATESDGKKDSQTVTFDVKGNKATVSSIDTSTGKVTIPETIEAPNGKTYTVTKLDKEAFDGLKLKELSLPETIKVINPKALENTGLKTLNLTGKNTKLKKNCLKNTNKNLVIKVTTKAEKRNIEKQLKKAGNPKAKVKVSKKK